MELNLKHAADFKIPLLWRFGGIGRFATFFFGVALALACARWFPDSELTVEQPAQVELVIRVWCVRGHEALFLVHRGGPLGTGLIRGTLQVEGPDGSVYTEDLSLVTYESEEQNCIYGLPASTEDDDAGNDRYGRDHSCQIEVDYIRSWRLEVPPTLWEKLQFFEEGSYRFRISNLAFECTGMVCPQGYLRHVPWRVPWHVKELVVKPRGVDPDIYCPLPGENEDLDKELVVKPLRLDFKGDCPLPGGNEDQDSDHFRGLCDGCPFEPEDIDGFEDDDGCPEPNDDADRDGVVDDRDGCIEDPEDHDGFEDEDGCPELDNDGDGVPDHRDRCINEPETFNCRNDDDGCPDPELTLYLYRIPFNPGEFDEPGFGHFSRIVEDARCLAKLNKTWKVYVSGFAAGGQSKKERRKLAQRRAQKIAQILTEHGIPSKDIVKRNCGHVAAPLPPGTQLKNSTINKDLPDGITQQPNSCNLLPFWNNHVVVQLVPRGEKVLSCRDDLNSYKPICI